MTGLRRALVPLDVILDDAAADDAAGRPAIDAVADLRPAPPVVVRLLRAGEREYACGPTEVRLRRDVLDAPVYDATLGRTVRVGQLWLWARDDGRLEVAGVDVRPRNIWLRLLPFAHRGTIVVPADLLPLSEVHLASRQGHAAQLRVASSLAHRLDDGELAQLLTSLPIQMAAEVVQHLPDDRAASAIGRLHPEVAERLARGLGQATHRVFRRTRRTSGWRLHRPVGRAPEAPRDGGGQRRSP